MRPSRQEQLNKAVRDALRDCGAVVDDSAEWLTAVETEVAKGPKATLLYLDDVQEQPR